LRCIDQGLLRNEGSVSDVLLAEYGICEDASRKRSCAAWPSCHSQLIKVG